MGNLKVWEPEIDVVMPIMYEDILGFKKWVNWNGYSATHKAFDFAAYIDERDKCVLGLPEETPIRAIADGVVRQVFDPGVYGSYNVFIYVEHGEMNTNMFSSYYHVKPLVDEGQEVRKGDVISTLHKDPGNEEGLLVHLHFSLCNAWDIRPRDVDPLEILPEFELLYAEPQGRKRFMVKGLNQQPDVHIANFDELLLDEK